MENKRIFGSTSFFAKLAEQHEAAMKKKSPRERAEYRAKVRQAFELPPQPKPDLWKN
jgi:hypothetical protein